MNLLELYKTVPRKTLEQFILVTITEYDDCQRETDEKEICERIERLIATKSNHPVDCLCPVCR